MIPLWKMGLAERLGFSPRNSPPILDFYLLDRMTATSGYGVLMLPTGKGSNPHVNGKSSSTMTH